MSGCNNPFALTGYNTRVTIKNHKVDGRDLGVFFIKAMAEEFEALKSKQTLIGYKEKIDDIYSLLGDADDEELSNAITAVIGEISTEIASFKNSNSSFYSCLLIPVLEKISLFLELAKKEIGTFNMFAHLENANDEIESYLSANVP